MRRVELTDSFIKELIWARAVDLNAVGQYGVQKHGVDTQFDQLCCARLGQWFNPRRARRMVFNLTVEGRALAKAIIEYEEENPRYSAHEGASAILHGGTLFSWSHIAAVREVENVRGVRQRNEERKAAWSGREGCHETRSRAAPRPNVDICVDDCRHGKGVR